MKLYIVIDSDVPGIIPMFGQVGPDINLVLDEFDVVKLEARTRSKFGEINLPIGVRATLYVLEDDQELDAVI